LLLISFSNNNISHSIQSISSQPEYGNRSDNVHLSAEDADKIDLSMFDEKHPYQHMMKIMYGCGVFCMFRGREHANFLVSQVKFGHYPRTFEHAALAGHPYVAISNLTDKTHILTVNNSYARGTSEVLRFPINEDDPADFGGALQRYMNKLSPGQLRMYCRLASDQFIAATYRRHGNSTSIFHPNLPLGINKVKELICQGADILGIPRNFRPHSLRAVGVTKLANSRGVSDAERCRAARHSTVNASRAYQTVDGRSEASRLLALGVRIPDAPSPPPQVETKIPSSHQEEEEEVEFVDITNHNSGSDSDGESVPPLKIRSKEKRAEKPEPSMTQKQIEVFKEEFSSLQGLISNKKKRKASPEPQSMTQADIDDLKLKVEELKDVMAGGVKKSPPPMSQNQLAILELRQQVKRLKDSLEEKDLYCDSLENDFFRSGKQDSGEGSNVRESQEMAYRIRDLQRENRELLHFISRDEDRNTRRSYRKY
jgi:hypothetical protein